MSVSNHIVNTAVIGAGFAGLSAAAYLAKAGCNVDIFEKNADIGARAHQLITKNGYTFIAQSRDIPYKHRNELNALARCSFGQRSFSAPEWVT